jgi:isocitrate dehydrogenase (NAD+)
MTRPRKTATDASDAAAGRVNGTNRHRVTLLVGDGAGPEVADATLHVLEAAGVAIDWQEATAGERAFVNYGTALPSATLDAIRATGVALKGRLRGPPGVANPNVTLRRELGLGAQVRPVKSLPGSRYPNLDLVVVRETTEGEYAGLEHRVVPGVVESIKVVTEAGCTRIAEFAFAFAARAGRKKVAAIHKANILKVSDGLFLESVRKVASRYPAIALREMIVDATCMQLVVDPYRFDVLVMESFYGDLIADLCAGLAGGISAARNASHCDRIAVFEPVHYAPSDWVGRNLANPLPLLGSAVLMLEHLGERDAAARIDRAIARVLEERRVLTRDLGGSARTIEVAREIARALD